MSHLRLCVRTSSIVAWTFLVCTNGAQVHTQGQEQTNQPRLALSVEAPLGVLSGGPLYWHIHEFPTRAAAEAARGPRGTVADVFDRHWIYTIADAAGRPGSGEKVEGIGTCDVPSNEAC